MGSIFDIELKPESASEWNEVPGWTNDTETGHPCLWPCTSECWWNMDFYLTPDGDESPLPQQKYLSWKVVCGIVIFLPFVYFFFTTMINDVANDGATRRPRCNISVFYRVCLKNDDASVPNESDREF